MKALVILTTTMLIALTGCETAPIAERAEIDQRYPNQEPYSKEQVETIEERAGAQTQSREGIEDNPFIEPQEDDAQRRREQRVVLP